MTHGTLHEGVWWAFKPEAAEIGEPPARRVAPLSDPGEMLAWVVARTNCQRGVRREAERAGDAQPGMSPRSGETL
jgi:hypothetical protein